jgi:hypothetical protein
MSQTATETATAAAPEEVQSFTIPKECKAGVVVNEGPEFHIVRLHRTRLFYNYYH